MRCGGRHKSELISTASNWSIGPVSKPLLLTSRAYCTVLTSARSANRDTSRQTLGLSAASASLRFAPYSPLPRRSQSFWLKLACLVAWVDTQDKASKAPPERCHSHDEMMTTTPSSVLLRSNCSVPWKCRGLGCVVRNLAHCQCLQASALKTAYLLRCGNTYVRDCATTPEGSLSPNSELGLLSTSHRDRVIVGCAGTAVLAGQHQRNLMLAALVRLGSETSPGLHTMAVCWLGRF